MQVRTKYIENIQYKHLQIEERLCNDDGNEILTSPLPNPSETARLEIRTNEHEPLANANEHHQQHAHSSKQAKSKVV